MKGSLELSVNWLYIIIALILGVLLLLVFLPLVFGSSVYSYVGKEVCLLTVGKLFSKPEICEVFI